MTTFLVAYDLTAETTSSADLTQAIRLLSHRWARPLASVWYLEGDVTVEEIEFSLSPLLASDDALMVQEVKGSPALINTMTRWTAGERGSYFLRTHQLHLAANGDLPVSDQTIAEAA